MNSKSEPSAENDRILPSETGRAVISFLIIVHFFAVAVAVTSTSTFLRASPLMTALHNSVFQQYLSVSWLGVPYDYALTYGGQLDVGAVAVVEYTSDDGKPQRVVLPDPQRAAEPRQRAFQQMLNMVAVSPREGEQSVALMTLVAKDALRQTGARKATVYCRFLREDQSYDRVRTIFLTPLGDRIVSGPESDRDYATIASGQVVKASNGSVTYLSFSGTSESAPVARPATPP